MLDSILTNPITLTGFLICTFSSLLLGITVAGIFMFRNRYTKSFVVTLALLPAIVQAIIMLVNGNLGTGIAVAGAFSLIRFRSIAGGAKEIGSIFFAMALGLAIGMGYIAIAVMLLIIVGGAMLLLSSTRFGEFSANERELRITIPENLNYEGIFEDLFKKYTSSAELFRVKTTNMGTLYELNYHIVMRSQAIEKSFLDELRCRNGNLNIVCGQKPSNLETL